MAVSLVAPVVSSVARKAAGQLVQTVTRMWGIDADRDKLERRLLAVQYLLADAEVKSEANDAVRRWMKDLKAAAYRADHVLDHFQYEALRRQAQQGHRSMMSSKVLNHFTRDNPLLFRFKVSRQLKDVLRKIDDLVEEMNKFGLVERAEAPQVLYRKTYSLLDDSEEIFGRDGNKEEVVKLLLDHQDQRNVQVLPITGMGGLGKTALAKMVYNDSRVQKHFELKMWHCVSDNFDTQCLLRAIVELAKKGSCGPPDNIELLVGELLDVIGRRRFLLILDDVWNEDENKWEDHLRPLLCSSIGGPGSVIVVTSRSQKVASIMGTLPSLELACLSEDDAWKLFSRKAFGKGVQEKEELITIGRRIVHKCKGLPLALKTMGGLMSSKQIAQEWMSIADSNIGDTSGGKDGVLSVLKLSYKYLSTEMKQCFAFCAIFPKDCEMEKDVLIQLWMANNFIHQEGMVDLTQKGEFIFNELVLRSFFQDVREVDSTLFGRQSVLCKMHDLMHDLAKDVTEECVSAEELILGKASIKCVHHIAMSSHFDQLSEMNRLLKRAPSLRTLLADELTYKDIEELKLKSLRALRCKEPSHSMAKYSRYLKYLDLSWSNIVILSDSICMMYNLQSLQLNSCYKLQYLPEGLATSLRNLRYISLVKSRGLKETPPKLSLLHNLHTLTRFFVGNKHGCGIEELKDLRQLSNRLELCELRKVKSGSKANLHEKHNLRELSLEWNHEESDILTNDDIINEEEVLESLVPPDELKVLEVRGYHGIQFSQWMRDTRMFQQLRKLIISDCPRCTYVPLIWLSSSLENLYLAFMDNLTTLCNSIDMEAAGYNNLSQVFPNLKHITLSYLRNLESWTELPHSFVMFPRLQELEVSNCPKLATLPQGPVLACLTCHCLIFHTEIHSSEGIVPVSMPLAAWPSLVRLDVGGMLVNVNVSLEEQQGQIPNTLGALQYLNIEGGDAFTSIFNIPKLQSGLAGYFANVEELNIFGSMIASWPVEELRYFPRLRSLTISGCWNLGDVSSSEDFVPSLERLSIQYCPNLPEVPQLPLSLKTLQLKSCPSLVALPSNLGNLPKLSNLSIQCCPHLKALPDGMDGLTSLEWLTISECQGIEEFSPGLLQQLPSLKYLCIFDNPVLQRRCREGGEYFNLVSSIPKININATVEPETNGVERPAKRFLPFCR